MTDEETLIPETAPRMDVVHQIAKTLSDRRAQRSLSLEKVTQAIKIRMQYLQAIERGEWSELPGEVYVRGFIRRYAQYLGLDGEKLIAPYIKMNESPSSEKKEEPTQPGSESSRTQWIWVVLAGIFLIGLIKVIKQESTTPAKPVVNSNATVAVKPPETAVAKKEEVPVAPKAPLAPHELMVFSPFPLWLRVGTPEKSFEGFVPQGSSWSWKGEGEFSVRLGHTKEVSLFFDGKPIPLSEDQKLVTLP